VEAGTAGDIATDYLLKCKSADELKSLITRDYQPMESFEVYYEVWAQPLDETRIDGKHYVIAKLSANGEFFEWVGSGYKSGVGFFAEFLTPPPSDATIKAYTCVYKKQ